MATAARHALNIRLAFAKQTLACLTLGACSGNQSALDAAGQEAASIALLFWVMVAGGALIWLLVVALLLYAARSRDHSERAASRVILWGGAVLPSVVVIGLLTYALWLMPALRPFTAAAASALRIEVTGRQFWWRVVYRSPEGVAVTSANEIRLPVGQRVELRLASDDVIHSFWVPSLGGKMDMIPGRTNRLSLQATKSGIYRGPCAEYCGTSHALMALQVVALPPEAFDRWLAAQAKPSPAVGRRGADLFQLHGCGACHAIAGTEAKGVLGPDLSHLGSRTTLAAGILPNTTDDIERFITAPERIKPGAKMPAFGMLPREDIRVLAAWLRGLE